MKKYTKVSLNVVYEKELIQKISAVMSRYDLGIESIHCPISENYSWKLLQRLMLITLRVLKTKLPNC